MVIKTKQVRSRMGGGGEQGNVKPGGGDIIKKRERQIVALRAAKVISTL